MSGEEAKARILNNALQEIGMGKYQIVIGLILMPVVNEFNVLGPWLKLTKNIGLLVGLQFACQLCGLLRIYPRFSPISVNGTLHLVEMKKQSRSSTKLQRTTNPTLEDLQMARKLADAAISDGTHMDTSALAAMWRKIFSNNHVCANFHGHPHSDLLGYNSFVTYFLATQGANFGDSSTYITYCNNCGYSYTSNVMYGVLYALSPELFPTKDRGTGNVIMATANRIFGVMLYSSTYHFISHQTLGRLGKLTWVLHVGNTSEHGREVDDSDVFRTFEEFEDPKDVEEEKEEEPNHFGKSAMCTASFEHNLQDRV
ncbi:hypothetical protein EDB19DRAFT_2027969 [Suillus lakei]|nr:hypothetical protein EDB19DRAFT_2027969 [Suillus lakei]